GLPRWERVPWFDISARFGTIHGSRFSPGMGRMNRQTTLAKTGQTDNRWYIVDASDQVLGRISARLARVLMGKHKPIYTPHVDTGDFVVVTNVGKLRLTGNKEEAKVFQTYSGYPGGQKRFTYKWMLEHKPELLLQRSVRRMMPKSK